VHLLRKGSPLARCISKTNGSEPLEKIATVARNVIENLVTIGFSLDHCSVPGRNSEEFLSANEVEIGMGIHNEPGVNRLSLIPTSAELASKLLKLLLDKSDPDRAFVPFNQGDETVLVVNNLGSISNLELSAFAGIAIDQLDATYGIKPTRVYVGTYMTALNGPGISLTLLNVSKLSDSSTVLAALDAPTTALGWTDSVSPFAWTRAGKLDLIPSPPDEGHGNVAQVGADPATFTKVLQGAANALIKAEPEITKYDTIGTASSDWINAIAGDGDCGETLVAGSNAILSALKSNSLPLSNAVAGTLALASLVEDNMGGTSGALYSIYLSALAQGIAQSKESEVSLPVIAKAAEFALSALGKYTPARVGDRTLVDALAPFVEELSESQDLWKAVEAAREGYNLKLSKLIAGRRRPARWTLDLEERVMLVQNPCHLIQAQLA
jgi:triose/dihydroxyacetone kinase / FAD-AMP lyase (cyclizing)